MSAIYSLQSSFNSGEVTPLLRSRIDAEFWKSALETCENYTVLLHGGIRKRSGTRFVAEAYDSDTVSRLFPFIFSNRQSYVIEVSGAGKVGFLASRGRLGAPYTVDHQWAEGDIEELTYVQANDVAHFAHKEYPPQKLSRLGDTSWTLADAVFKDGPYLDESQSGTTLTPAQTGAITPKMTGLTAPSGTAAGTGAIADAWEAFDRDPSTVAAIAATAGFISYDFAGTSTKIADAYWLQASVANPENTPSNWVFEGYDGTNWHVIDRRIDEIGWSAGERRYFDFPNKTAYESYRLTWTSVDGGTASHIAGLEIHEAGDGQTPFNLTASSVAGINDGDGFQATDVGRTIRLLGADGRWRWARIAAYTSSTVVTIRLYGHALPDTSAIVRWALGAFSDYSGYPALVTLFENRLMWGRTDTKPVSVWGSKAVDLEDMGYSVPLVATDAIGITLLSKDMNELNWLAGDEDLVTGSLQQIRSIGPDDTAKGFSALNVKQRKGPNSGASEIPPISIGGSTLYVGAGGRKIRELVMGEQGRYVAPELSILGEHAYAAGISAWAFSENPEPTIFAVTGDGQLVALLYDREQRVVGVSRFVLPGGRIESIAVIPSGVEGYDDVYLCVQRTINGVAKRYIEVLDKPFDYANDSVEDGFFVDCGATYEGPATSALSGLDHLEGEEVVALADGAVVTGMTVTGGAITLPYEASVIHVGLGYASKAVTLPSAGPGQDGVLFGRRTTNTAVFVDLLATGSLKVGAAGEGNWEPPLYEVNPHAGSSMAGNPVDLISGFRPCEIEGSWAQGEGRIVLVSEAPLPCLIRSVVLKAEREP